MGLSRYWTNELQQYAVSRLLVPRMLALLAFLVVAVWYGSQSESTGGESVGPAPFILATLRDLLLLASLVTQFRLQDDLADVSVDRQDHPHRALVLSDHLAKFRWLVVVLSAVNLGIVGFCQPVLAVVGLAAINGLVIGWYQFSTRRDWPTVNYHVLLLKYPAFVFVIGFHSSLDFGSKMATALLAVYLALCVYEVWHDVKLRKSRAPTMVARCELAILVVLLALETTWSLQIVGQAGSLPHWTPLEIEQ